MTPVASTRTPTADTTPQVGPLPDTARITAATIGTWRRNGYRISEQRRAEWLYLLVRGVDESAVYKLVGPTFHGPHACYQGSRIA